MPLTKELIDQAFERYWREYDRYAKLADFVGEACRKLLETNVIRGSVQWRAKNPESLRTKLLKYQSSGEHADNFTDLDSVFRVLKDLAGARITTYVETDRDTVVQLVTKSFTGFGDNNAVDSVVKDNPPQFYRATHCMVLLNEADLVGRYQNLKDLGCEVQVGPGVPTKELEIAATGHARIGRHGGPPRTRWAQNGICLHYRFWLERVQRIFGALFQEGDWQQGNHQEIGCVSGERGALAPDDAAVIVASCWGDQSRSPRCCFQLRTILSRADRHAGLHPAPGRH